MIILVGHKKVKVVRPSVDLLFQAVRNVCYSVPGDCIHDAGVSFMVCRIQVLMFNQFCS